MESGRIIKGVGGLYFVETPGGMYECSARGIFRKENITPLVGDMVNISLESGKGRIDEILARRNFLVRPPVANIDLLFIVTASAEPEPSTFLIDKITAVAVHKDITPVICINKTDLSDGKELFAIYTKSGFDTISMSAETGEGVNQIISRIKGRTAVFTGVSGVGKSSLLQRIAPDIHAATQAISEKTRRGRHTTRHVEIYKVYDGYIIDTPGFSNLDIERFEMIRKDELAGDFPDIAKYMFDCRYTGCVHIGEKDCAVISAVGRGDICKSRYESFKVMYNEVKDIKDWQKR